MKIGIRLLPLGVIALLVYMPFHVFVSQSLSLATGGLDFWKIGKDIFTLGILLLAVGLAIYNRQQFSNKYWWLLGLALGYGGLHLLLFLLYRETDISLAAVATAYNGRLFAYFIIAVTAVVLLPGEMLQKRLVQTVLVVSTVVCILGILQFLLPKDLLSNVGYSAARGIRAAFFIDDKPNLPRINSTIRDPNSFGAYLLIPISILWLKFLGRTNRQKVVLALLGLHLLALLLTFSRAAWAATVITVSVAAVLSQKRWLRATLKRYWPVAFGALVVMLVAVIPLRDQYFVQNVIFHSDENTVSTMDSNDYHVSFARQGLQGIVQQPMGHGPATAGLVSIQKPGGGLLTENYFIQIGYEVGVIGLGMFVAALVFIMVQLLRRRQDLATALFAAFCGYLLMAMVAHLWSNEAVALNAWLLSGVVLGSLFASKAATQRS